MCQTTACPRCPVQGHRPDFTANTNFKIEKGDDSIKITEKILTILAKCRVEGNTLFLPGGQLDRETYLAVNKCLTNIGGKWNRKTRGHVFDHDSSDDLDTMLLTGETADMKKVYQFFPTPKKVAEQICDMAELDADCVVLEPSCGRGDLADVIYVAGATNLLGLELNTDMWRYLADKPYQTVVGVDFLQFTEEAENQGTFTRIVMNPPFSKHQDVDHILAAYKLLIPGGILVSVSSPSPFWRTDRKSVEFQNWIQAVNAQVVDVPEGTFKESGTMLRTKIVKVRKPVN